MMGDESLPSDTGVPEVCGLDGPQGLIGIDIVAPEVGGRAESELLLPTLGADLQPFVNFSETVPAEGNDVESLGDGLDEPMGEVDVLPVSVPDVLDSPARPSDGSNDLAATSLADLDDPRVHTGDVARLEIELGNERYVLEGEEAAPGSITLSDRVGVTIYSDLDGDGVVDKVSTVRFDGSYDAWDFVSGQPSATEGAVISQEVPRDVPSARAGGAVEFPNADVVHDCPDPARTSEQGERPHDAEAQPELPRSFGGNDAVVNGELGGTVEPNEPLAEGYRTGGDGTAKSWVLRDLGWITDI